MDQPSFWRKVRGALLDITGVLYESGVGASCQAIKGSVEAVNRLKEAGFPYRFVSNETQCCRKDIARKLNKVGFTIQPEEIICPSPAVASLLKEKGLRPYLLVHPDVLSEFKAIDTSSPNCVVVGDAAEYFTYDHINAAFRVLLQSKDPLLIAMGKGKYYRHNGELTLDVGAYVAGLEYASDTKALVIGKPSKDFFMSALSDLNIGPSEAVMIGDDIVHDVGGAQTCGLYGVLVRTGKYRQSDESHSQVQPDAIIDNLEEGVKMLLHNRK